MNESFNNSKLYDVVILIEPDPVNSGMLDNQLVVALDQMMDI